MEMRAFGREKWAAGDGTIAEEGPSFIVIAFLWEDGRQIKWGRRSFREIGLPPGINYLSAAKTRNSREKESGEEGPKMPSAIRPSRQCVGFITIVSNVKLGGI